MHGRTGRTGPRPEVTAGDGGRAVVLALLAVGMAAAATALVVRGLHVAATLPTHRVEPYLELPVLAGGALAAAWVGLSALAALACVAARSAGSRWSRGERLVARLAPAVVRRAARIGVSVTVGAGLVLGGGAAHAAEPDAGDSTSAVAVVDLGWRPSAPQVDAGTVDGPGPAASPEATAAAGDAGAPRADDDTDTASAPAGRPTTPTAPGTLPDDVAVDEPAGKHADKQTAAQSGAQGGTPDAPSPAAGAAVADAAPPVSGSPTAAPEADAAATAAVAPHAGAPAPLPAAERDAALTVTRDVPHPAGEVVVLRGDTLWSIAARTLPADASDADVAAAVQRWHAANEAVIGGDPDLIRPGQVLVAPTA